MFYLGVPDSVRAQLLPLQARPEKEANLTPRQRKIHGLVRSMAAALKAEGINGSNAARRNAANRFSSPLIKVDDHARIHLYIELTEVNSVRLNALERTGQIVIQIADPDLKLVQAWVPYERIEAIANLDFVTRVRPPEYATFLSPQR